MKKKILIPYASYGTGHKSTALYIKDYFEKNGDYECMTIDLLTYSVPVIGNLSKKTSEFLMTKLPSLWSIIYYAFDNKLSAYINKNIFLKLFNDKKLQKDILDFEPDISIATHFLGTDLMSKYNNKGLTNAKLVSVVTDYKAHDFWLNNVKKTDAIIVGSFLERIHLLKKGYQNKQIFTTGIPISPEIKEKLDREKLKKKYKVDNDKKTILFFVGGGNGATYNLIYLKELLKSKYDCNILFVSGKNKTALKKSKYYAKKYGNNNIRIFGFVTNINELYEVSDFVITKPGGIQVTECLLFERPMLLIKGNGGQEIDNRRFLIKSKYALSAYNKYSFNKKLDKLMTNEKLFNELKQNIKKVKQNKSMEKLFKIIEKL